MEVHGNKYDFQRLRHRFKDFRFRQNPGYDNRTGGVIIGYRKSTFSCAKVPTFQLLSVGKFVRLHFSFEAQESLPSGGDLIFWGIHDYKIPDADSRHGRTSCQSDFNYVSTRPLNLMLVFGGDLN